MQGEKYDKYESTTHHYCQITTRHTDNSTFRTALLEQFKSRTGVVNTGLISYFVLTVKHTIGKLANTSVVYAYTANISVRMCTLSEQHCEHS